jgi:hypothetical protein
MWFKSKRRSCSRSSTPFPSPKTNIKNLSEDLETLSTSNLGSSKKRNVNNNYIDDQEDIVQDLRIAMLRAGSYFKRQTYIEASLKAVLEHTNHKDSFEHLVAGKLAELWDDRKRHGANRQKFGPLQERLLERLSRNTSPKSVVRIVNKPLQIDHRFVAYCKGITWNEQKRLGKMITREKSIRCGMVSLSEFDFLGA